VFKISASVPVPSGTGSDRPHVTTLAKAHAVAGSVTVRNLLADRIGSDYRSDPAATAPASGDAGSGGAHGTGASCACGFAAGPETDADTDAGPEADAHAGTNSGRSAAHGTGPRRACGFAAAADAVIVCGGAPSATAAFIRRARRICG
jgi:hypothetical protein